MNIVKAKAVWEHTVMGNYQEMLKGIEKIGRVCYKSEENITEGSAEKFVKMIVKRGHESVLEHAVVIYQIFDDELYVDLKKNLSRFSFIRFSEINAKDIVSGNIRTWREIWRDGNYGKSVSKILDDLKYDNPVLFHDFEYHDPYVKTISAQRIHYMDCLTPKQREIHGYYTARFICDRGVTHEIVRHRNECSYSQESTRYCNYSKNGELNFINVVDGIALDLKMAGLSSEKLAKVVEVWEKSLKQAEEAYLKLIELGATPQIARSVLPNSLKTEIVMSATHKAWEHFFELRMNPAAHPQMRQVAEELEDTKTF
jgi:thymidylate synthase (FAD)